MIDRIPSGFNPFVLPFLFGMIFVLSYCLYGIVRILLQLSHTDRKKFFLSLITPKIMVKNCWQIFTDCLIHVKLWKRNKVLGYMHSSIAFGWFMLIVLGHLEVFIYVPQRVHLFYYPIFFNYFIAEADATIGGAVLMFLMDFFLLIVLSGIMLAIVKRVHSRLFGMKHTTRPSLVNLIGMYSLWAIFPLRWLAESFTAHISGGSFLTLLANWLFRQFLGNDLNMLPTWWAYSIALGVFMCVLPFSRYMHIPAEMMLIPMRNAGLKIKNPWKGFARLQVMSCPNCGVCIDACPMSADKNNLKDCTVYLARQMRRGNLKRVEEISDKCLLCGKCKELCQVCVDGPQLRVSQRATRQYNFSPDYSDIETHNLFSSNEKHKVAYFSGCMSQLTPTIGRSVESILKKAEVDYVWLDRDGGLCCGRPLLTAGRTDAATQLQHKNEEMIRATGADILLVSCPICYRMFIENYDLQGIRIVHYSIFFAELLKQGRLKMKKGDTCYVFHDPCELGRGCGIYDEPRQLIGKAACISEADKCRNESLCCGGSLGSLSLSFEQRETITRATLENLYTSKADAIATACPLCLATLSRYADRPVKDLAEIIDTMIVVSG